MLTSLYIHIPFCDYICTYCDFHKALAKDDKKQQYIDALLIELEMHAFEFSNLKTVYIGGGTPLSISPALLEKLLTAINKMVDVDNLIEFSIETNPENLTAEKVLLLKKYGINRVSIGVQTFNEDLLSSLGRKHHNIDVLKGIELLRSHQINNINIDMIFAFPDQKIEDLEDDLNILLSIDVEHISYYSLILEEKTLLYRNVMLEKVIMPNEEIEAEMFDIVIKKLKENSYHHYEISNFAKDGFESTHNKVYWYNEEYLGIGSGAHSHVNNKRFYHIPKISAYINQMISKKFDYYHIEEVDECQEACLLGLRLVEGISIDFLNKRCNMDVFKRFPMIKKHIENDLLMIDNGKLKLTKKGLFLGNVVFMTFVG